MNKKLVQLDLEKQRIYFEAKGGFLTDSQKDILAEISINQNEASRMEGENRYALYKSVKELNELGFEYDEILQMIEDMYDLNADRKWVFKNN